MAVGGRRATSSSARWSATASASRARCSERNRHGAAFDSPVAARPCFRRTSCSGAASSTSTDCGSPRAAAGSRTTCSWSSAYFDAERISVLADRPVYHWVRREEAANASYGRSSTPRATSTTCARCSTSSRPAPSPARGATSCSPTGTAARCSAASAARGWLRRDEEWRQRALRGGPQARAGALRRERPCPAAVQPPRALQAPAAQGRLRAGWSGSRASRRRLRSRIKLRGIERGGTHLRAAAGVPAGRRARPPALRAPRRAHVLGPRRPTTSRKRSPSPTARSPDCCAAPP